MLSKSAKVHGEREVGLPEHMAKFVRQTEIDRDLKRERERGRGREREHQSVHV